MARQPWFLSLVLFPIEILDPQEKTEQWTFKGQFKASGNSCDALGKSGWGLEPKEATLQNIFCLFQRTNFLQMMRKWRAIILLTENLIKNFWTNIFALIAPNCHSLADYVEKRHGLTHWKKASDSWHTSLLSWSWQPFFSLFWAKKRNFQTVSDIWPRIHTRWRFNSH